MGAAVRAVGLFLAGTAGLFVGALLMSVAPDDRTPFALFARGVTPPTGFVIITAFLCIFVSWRCYIDFARLWKLGRRSLLFPVLEGFLAAFAAEAVPSLAFLAPAAYAGMPLARDTFQGNPSGLWVTTMIFGVVLGIEGATVGLAWGAGNRWAIRLIRAAQQRAKPARLDRGTPRAEHASRHDSPAG